MIFRLRDGRTVSLDITVEQYARAWKLAGECDIRVTVPIPCPNGTTEHMDIRTFERLRLNGFRSTAVQTK